MSGLKTDIVITPPIDTLVATDFEGPAGDELERTMHAAAQLLHGAVIVKTPHAFGTLRSSIQPTVVRSASVIVGRVATNSPYAQPVELGSKPHWPPIGPLLLWAKRKYGDPRVAYIAQRAIARRGGRAHFMFRDAFAEQRGAIFDLFAAAIDRLLQRWEK